MKLRKSSILVKRKTTFTVAGNVEIVAHDSRQANTLTENSTVSKKIIKDSKKTSGNFKAGKNLWKNVPTAIRFANYPSVASVQSASDTEVDEKLREMCEKAFVTGEMPCKSYTLEEIGNYVGISRERVRQIEVQALNSARSQIKAQFGWEMDMRDLNLSGSDNRGDYSVNFYKK